jgi:hypothetical protein
VFVQSLNSRFFIDVQVEAFAAGVRVIQEDAQKDLDEALPALNAAVAALNSLTKGDITEVKSFAKPPPLVQTTMEAVCVLLGRKPDWETSKKLLGEVDFMEQLLNFDKDNIDPKRLKNLAKYISLEEFTAETVGKVFNVCISIYHNPEVTQLGLNTFLLDVNITSTREFLTRVLVNAQPGVSIRCHEPPRAFACGAWP